MNDKYKRSKDGIRKPPWDRYFEIPEEQDIHGIKYVRYPEDRVEMIQKLRDFVPNDSDFDEEDERLTLRVYPDDHLIDDETREKRNLFKLLPVMARNHAKKRARAEMARRQAVKEIRARRGYKNVEFDNPPFVIDKYETGVMGWGYIKPGTNSQLIPSSSHKEIRECEEKQMPQNVHVNKQSLLRNDPNDVDTVILDELRNFVPNESDIEEGDDFDHVYPDGRIIDDEKRKLYKLLPALIRHSNKESKRAMERGDWEYFTWDYEIDCLPPNFEWVAMKQEKAAAKESSSDLQLPSSYFSKQNIQLDNKFSRLYSSSRPHDNLINGSRRENFLSRAESPRPTYFCPSKKKPSAQNVLLMGKVLCRHLSPRGGRFLPLAMIRN